MKKNLARGSMLVVAALSLMLGGTSYTTNVKEQTSRTPEIVSKAIQNNVSDIALTDKGTPVTDVAELAKEENNNAGQVAQEIVNTAIEQKDAKVESDQVVACIDGYLNIRDSASEEGEVVGKFYTGNVGTIVEKGDEWSVVSSGNAYGYVKNEYLLFGDDAERYIENNCDQVAKVTADTLNVRAEESTDSEIVALTDAGDTLTILGLEGDWVKVAKSEEEVGYVSKDYIYLDYVYETAVTIEEEQAALEAEAAAEAAAQAEAEAAAQAAAQAAEQQAAQTQTVSETPSTQAQATTEAKKETKKETKTEAPVTAVDVSVSDGGSSTETVKQETVSTKGQEIANYAVQFVGNPYVYGGTSLTNGADCSGFVQSVFKNFGYSLPRTAADQAGAGTKVSTKELQPGDLLFYHGYGHVAIYIGGGQVVHASNAKTGIKISSYDYSPIDKAVRIAK